MTWVTCIRFVKWHFLFVYFMHPLVIFEFAMTVLY